MYFGSVGKVATIADMANKKGSGSYYTAMTADKLEGVCAEIAMELKKIAGYVNAMRTANYADGLRIYGHSEVIDGGLRGKLKKFRVAIDGEWEMALEPGYQEKERGLPRRVSDRVSDSASRIRRKRAKSPENGTTKKKSTKDRKRKASDT